MTGAILTPIYQSTTYIQDSIDDYLSKGYSYSRTTNPTVTALENKVAALEGAEGAVCFGTGMAATIAVISATMKAGDHCVIVRSWVPERSNFPPAAHTDLYPLP